MKRVKPIVLAALAVILIAGPVLADSREALRQRLDSINVEVQVRKRMGKPIDDLETAAAVLRDSIVGMRSASPYAADEPSGASDSSFLSSIGSMLSSLAGSAVSFRPTGLFDWIIVSTGVVAVLSGLLLFIGIVAGRRKGKKKTAAAQGYKRINHATAESPLPVLPDPPKPAAVYNIKVQPDGVPPPPPVPPALADLPAPASTAISTAAAPPESGRIGPSAAPAAAGSQRAGLVPIGKNKRKGRPKSRNPGLQRFGSGRLKKRHERR
jgi:hypothetical protein